MSRSKIPVLAHQPSDKPEINVKYIRMVRELSLSITEFKNDVLVRIRVRKNRFPTVVNSLAESFVCAAADTFDLQEKEEVLSESLVIYDNPNPVFWIDETRYLTAREVKIMERLSLGRLNKEIAGDLNLKECTIKNNLQRIFRKLMVNNRSEAILEYLKAKGRMNKSHDYAN
jgi:DNA-binding CsgD family transcriptional regulator